ncbi:MAG: ACT domain-containing protein, partial [Methylococcaceae bacterium]|nr:ACT domain-containing protein [Methylococcaceae bacterium]
VAVSVEIARQAVTFLNTGEAVNALNLPRVSAKELKRSQRFMNLAGSLGKVLAGLASKPLQKIEINLVGGAAEVESRPVAVAALIGVLSDQVSTPVNRVNAENIAKRQGLSIVEVKTYETEDYLSLIKLVGHHADGTVSLTGTLLGGRQPRLVNIDQFEIEVIPEGTLLITRHEDKPGVISAISTVLGQAQINITRMQVSTAENLEHAMAVISVSEPLTEELLQQLCALEPVYKAIQIKL